MSSAICSINYTNNADLSKRMLSRAIKTNALAMTLSIVIICVCLLLLFFVIRSIIRLARNHTSRTKSTSTSKNNNESDDIKYTGKKRIDLPVEPESLRVLAKLDEIKALYDPYNHAVSDYAMRVKGEKTPDDLINESILSRRHDSFDYTGTSAKEAPFSETEQRAFRTV